MTRQRAQPHESKATVRNSELLQFWSIEEWQQQEASTTRMLSVCFRGPFLRQMWSVSTATWLTNLLQLSDQKSSPHSLLSSEKWCGVMIKSSPVPRSPKQPQRSIPSRRKQACACPDVGPFSTLGQLPPIYQYHRCWNLSMKVPILARMWVRSWAIVPTPRRCKMSPWKLSFEWFI